MLSKTNWGKGAGKCRHSTAQSSIGEFNHFMSIVKTTYKDQVVEYIYDLILDGTLSHGNQIKESLLSHEMGISRAPIREALKELITTGIIAYRPQVGNFIAQPSPKETIDAYITRGVLEGYAIMETCNQFTEEEFDELETMTTAMKKAAIRENHKRVTHIGSEFHNTLISKNKNIQLVEYTERLSLKLHILFYKHWGSLYTPEEIGNRHLRIVEAIRAGNLTQIEQVARDHYTETGTKIASLQRKSQKDYQSKT